MGHRWSSSIQNIKSYVKKFTNVTFNISDFFFLALIKKRRLYSILEKLAFNNGPIKEFHVEIGYNVKAFKQYEST